MDFFVSDAMAVLFLLLLPHMYGTVLAAFCKKEFFYHQHYSYGYDIYCNNLDNESMSELTDAVVYNEIKLTVEYSDFMNTNWYLAKHLSKLREINLISCHLSNSNIFKKLRKLRLLNIRHSKVDQINYDYFDGLDDLQQLLLQNNSLNNSFVNSFRNLKGLTVINLNNNNFKGIFNISNCTLYNLKQIYLQHNQIEGLGNMSCLMYIEEVYFDFNSISDLVNIDQLLNLKILSLGYNKIRKLTTLQNLPNLEILNVEDNKLVELNEEVLYSFEKLKYLNLRNNHLTVLSDTFFANIRNLRYLNLNNNNIDDIDLKYLPYVEELHLANNRLPSLKPFSNTINLKKIDVSSNSIKMIEEHVFSRLLNITSLNLSHNDIEDNIYDASFFGLASLTELQAENISSAYIPEDVFTFCNRLQILNLSQNKMKGFGTLFQKLSNLQVLNISYNQLEELRYDTISNLHNLHVIDVEGNRLQNIEYESIVSDLHKLTTINIKNNTLTCEFLTRMITFFTNNHVNYTINEEFSYDKENVAGIYCKETRNKLNDTLRQTAITLEDKSFFLKLANLTQNSTNEFNKTIVHSVIYATMAVVLVSVILIFGIYKVYIYLKRRHYCSDEFELIGRDKD